MKHRSIPLQRAALSAVFIAAAALSTGAKAAISTDPDGGELFLVVVDQVNAKMSYTLDLGQSAKQFWVTAQQDNGASFFRTLDPSTDSSFQTFINAANPATTSWMILGFGANLTEAVFSNAFTTLTNNGLVATQTKSFDDMKGLLSQTMTDKVAGWSTIMSSLNGATNAQILASTHDTTDHGSAVASKDAGNSTTYFSNALDGNFGGPNNTDGSCNLSFQVCAGNPIGTSSWFYRLTPTLVDPADPVGGGVDNVGVIVDEFDNLSADGYWGFIKDPASAKYILSYTLAGANPTALVSTDDGRVRLSTIDYSAQSGSARLIGGLAADDVAFQVGTVSAVPEPESWGLMLAGMATLAGARRLRRAKQD